MAIEIHTGMMPGRIVWGHPGKPQIKKDQNTKQPVLRDGKPVEQWAFGVAWPKDYFQQNIWPHMLAESQTAYPSGTPPKFSWKYVDGDSIDSKGKLYSLREGYAGCYILTVSTEAFAPPVYKLVNGAYVQLTPDQIKTGDYVALGLMLKVNVPTNPAHSPGLYVNPQAIELVAYGTEIQNAGSVDPNAVFGGKQYQLPPGASEQPMVTPAGAQMPGMGGGMMPGQPQMQPGMPMQQPQPQMQPGMPMQQPQPQMQPGMPMQQPQQGMMPAPAHDFVQNAGMPMQQPQMQPGMPGQMPGMMPGR